MSRHSVQSGAKPNRPVAQMETSTYEPPAQPPEPSRSGPRHRARPLPPQPQSHRQLERRGPAHLSLPERRPRRTRLAIVAVVTSCIAMLSAAGAPTLASPSKGTKHNARALPAENPQVGIAKATAAQKWRRHHHRRATPQPSKTPAPPSSSTPAPSVTSTPAQQAPPPPSSSPPVSIPGAGRPGAGNTGVPAGTALKRHDGDMTITTAGATYDGLDIHGFVTIAAPNVTIKRSIIRGGVAGSGSTGLVKDVDSHGTGFVLQDSELVPDHPSVAIDGIMGANYTLTRVNIHGTVDGAKVFGDNVTIKNSWIHGEQSYAHDPYQSNGPSHNDGIQILGGHNIHIGSNSIVGGSNSAVQITQDNSAVGSLAFSGNWVDGGACSVNVADKPMSSMGGITVSDNQFGHTSTYKNCAIIVSAGVSMSHPGNVWMGTSQAVAITPRT